MSVDAMIAAAEKWIGTGEPNAIQQWYRERNGADYNGNFAWCDAAVSYWATRADERDAVLFGHDFAYTVAHAARFKAAGRWHAMTDGIKASGIRRGDVIFFDWDGSSEIARIDHVGIVTGVSADHRHVFTIEGNTADVCARRARDVHDIAGFGRPEYKRSPKTPDTGGGTGSKRPVVSLSKLVAAFEKDAPREGTPVSYKPTIYVENALVAEKLLAKQYADGHAGSATRSAYSLWQERCGFHGTEPGGDADGTPGMTTLKRLGLLHGFDVAA
ncbi:CHAP domain-containing protein [Streptomyces sp. NPDC046727]|uniref:CHAP domain-containing protein n=1 Tax=Streptomyces sp. NPDC046727 TaxID=3155373 RepID=UPI0033DDD52E